MKHTAVVGQRCVRTRHKRASRVESIWPMGCTHFTKLLSAVADKRAE